MSDVHPGRVPPGAALDQLKVIIDRMRDDRARWAHSHGSLDVVYANVVDDWADELEALRAALDAQPPQAPQKEQWQPIETHDGATMPVLIAEQGGDVVEAWLSEQHQTWWELNSCDDGAPGSDRRVYPTHWMPLPAPPVAEGRRAQEPPQ